MKTTNKNTYKSLVVAILVTTFIFVITITYNIAYSKGYNHAIYNQNIYSENGIMYSCIDNQVHQYDNTKVKSIISIMDSHQKIIIKDYYYGTVLYDGKVSRLNKSNNNNTDLNNYSVVEVASCDDTENYICIIVNK